VVVEAEVKEEQGRPLFGVNGVVRSKKDLTGPTLLEMYDYSTNQVLPPVPSTRHRRPLA
jgi:hypothetical protein